MQKNTAAMKRKKLALSFATKIIAIKTRRKTRVFKTQLIVNVA